jgi:hypothetical protein
MAAPEKEIWIENNASEKFALEIDGGGTTLRTTINGSTTASYTLPAPAGSIVTVYREKKKLSSLEARGGERYKISKAGAIAKV